jgi:hypothetical protein
MVLALQELVRSVQLVNIVLMAGLVGTAVLGICVSVEARLQPPSERLLLEGRVQPVSSVSKALRLQPPAQLEPFALLRVGRRSRTAPPVHQAIPVSLPVALLTSALLAIGALTAKLPHASNILGQQAHRQTQRRPVFRAHLATSVKTSQLPTTLRTRSMTAPLVTTALRVRKRQFHARLGRIVREQRQSRLMTASPVQRGINALAALLYLDAPMGPTAKEVLPRLRRLVSGTIAIRTRQRRLYARKGATARSTTLRIWKSM